jgi:GTPase SAR1 family protein
MILVGNKCDLHDLRVITTTQGEELARQFGCVFLEASAKTRVNIDNIFIHIVKQINKLTPPKEASKLGSKRKCVVL